MEKHKSEGNGRADDGEWGEGDDCMEREQATVGVATFGELTGKVGVRPGVEWKLVMIMSDKCALDLKGWRQDSKQVRDERFWKKFVGLKTHSDLDLF